MKSLDNDPTVKVIFEDNHLLVLDKPSGMLTQKDGSDALSLEEIAKCYIKEKYEKNYWSLILKIQETDNKARELFMGIKGSSFMIYHPNLAYLARDYNLKEISVEYEGKEPSPSRMKELIDLGRKDRIKTIFVQREFDSKNAKVIAREIGAEIQIIDPLSGDWYKATNDIIEALHNSLIK